MNELTKYYDFLSGKSRRAKLNGFKPKNLNSHLFHYQEDCLAFAIRAGNAAQFLDTGLGKSIIELDWARAVLEHTNKPVLMLAPLAVGPQHEREASKFGIDAKYIRNPSEIEKRINICNYERLHMFNPSDFGGLVLDESSIVKSFGGKTSKALMAFGDRIQYKLAATATPAPNDHMELGQHSQFLGAMDSNEMLARWFVADQSEMGRYRLKKYGIDDFWSWVASWARMASRPSDLGYSDDGFTLPPISQKLHYVDANITEGVEDGELFRKVEMSATSYHKEKRRTAPMRADMVSQLIAAEPTESWVIWCDTDYEADELVRRIPAAIEVRGSQPADKKESMLSAFSEGKERVLITKPSVAGFGLNWQHCARTVFAGLSFSYEAHYQATRRFWRFGQQRQVDAHIVLAETESAIWNTIQRKAKDHETMKTSMAKAMKSAIKSADTKIKYNPTQEAKIPQWLHSQ